MTFNYGRAEMSKVLDFEGSDGADFRIKLTSDAGETRWLSITRDQALRIGDILAEGSE